jgi:ABC-2 type transport system ATP-binding protein
MSGGSNKVVVAEGLVKIYPKSNGRRRNNGSSRPAVDNVSFEIRKGQIFGLLGPNGAGKTTTIKMLSTLLIPTSGTATVLDLDVERDYLEIRKRINLISGGERGLYYRISGRQNLRFFADLYRIPRKLRDRRVEDLLKKVGLESAADRRVEEYSRGMKQRLHIARGLVNDPDLLFLDEPTIGLDPEISREVRGMIREMSRDGKSLLLTTHNMHEAEELCDHINIIVGGRIVAKGTIADLKDAIRNRSVIEVEVRRLLPSVMDSLRSLDGVDGVTSTSEPYRSILRIQVSDERDMVLPIASRLGDSQIIRISREEPTLEDAYISMVNRDA